VGQDRGVSTPSGAADRLSALVGRRVALRHRLPVADGGPTLTDSVGELAYDGPSAVLVHTRRGVVRVARDAVVAVREIPPPMPRRPSWAAVARLERICADAWPPVVQRPLGQWWLRAAGGFTGRANSALVVGDPFGVPEAFGTLLASFDELCRTNDWAVAFIHTEPQYTATYKQADFSLQKIGEEAVLQLGHFENEVKNGKYFRQIRNKFTKQGYASEVLRPPHSPAVLQRLHIISNDWLAQPGRAERRFLMGYFNAAYMQQCPVMVLRDAAGTIQAFINQVPSFDAEEANFDLLRHTKDALGNANDFLLMEFIGYVQAVGFKRLNLGLCPLAGLDAQ